MLSRPPSLAMMSWALTFSSGATAALIDRGLFDNGVGGQIRLVYDDIQDITWLGDTDFAYTWAQATPGLQVINQIYLLPNGDEIFGQPGREGIMRQRAAERWLAHLDIGGFTGWRLPFTPHPDATCQRTDPDGISFGENCQGSEGPPKASPLWLRFSDAVEPNDPQNHWAEYR